jgi:hypothetical protein
MTLFRQSLLKRQAPSMCENCNWVKFEKTSSTTYEAITYVDDKSS